MRESNMNKYVSVKKKYVIANQGSLTLNLWKVVINRRAYAKQRNYFVNPSRENKIKKQTNKQNFWI